MRSLVLLGLFCFSLLPATLLAGEPGMSKPVVASELLVRKPNVILVMIDDLGWPDVGCYGNTFVDTPNIDALAKSGMRFTDFYAAGAVCSPTRCAVQTGQNQARIGITAHIPGHWRPFERVITPQVTMGLPNDIVTIGDAMKASGYRTGYIGKWHLNDSAGFDPSSKGYDFSAVINGAHYEGRYRVKGRKDLKPKPNQYRTDFEAELAKNFIRKNKDEPFFLMVSPFAVHIPLGAMADKVKKYRQRAKAQGIDLPHPVYAAMIEHCDDMMGRIVESVEKAGLTGNTMIIFTSDNGGLYRRYDYQEKADDSVASMKPLAGEKGTLYEGGIRVPLIVKFPGVVTAGGTCKVPTISYDFFPTLVAAAGGELPTNQTVDGLNLMPLLDGSAKSLDRDALYWHYPHYHHSRPSGCIREGDWKLIQYLDGSGDVELFNLKDDYGESKNLAADMPARRKELIAQLSKWRQSVLAKMPLKNPSYDPNRASEWWSRRAGKPVDSAARKRFPPTDQDQ